MSKKMKKVGLLCGVIGFVSIFLFFVPFTDSSTGFDLISELDHGGIDKVFALISLILLCMATTSSFIQMKYYKIQIASGIFFFFSGALAFLTFVDRYEASIGAGAIILFIICLFCFVINIAPVIKKWNENLNKSEE